VSEPRINISIGTLSIPMFPYEEISEGYIFMTPAVQMVFDALFLVTLALVDVAGMWNASNLVVFILAIDFPPLLSLCIWYRQMTFDDTIVRNWRARR
jgi:hypothetical protein